MKKIGPQRRLVWLRWLGLVGLVVLVTLLWREPSDEPPRETARETERERLIVQTSGDHGTNRPLPQEGEGVGGTAKAGVRPSPEELERRRIASLVEEVQRLRESGLGTQHPTVRSLQEQIEALDAQGGGGSSGEALDGSAGKE